MTDNTENLIIEHLRLLRNEVQTIRTEMNNGFADLKKRVNSVEEYAALIHSDIATIHQRLDHHEQRLDRIEKRLELTT